MIKVHYDDDQPELLKACGGQMWQLIDTERGVKSAASEAISKDIIERFRPDKDHFLIHKTIMGDTETYGQNRNQDGWSKQALLDRHHTFVTEGHMYREHRNRDPKQRIGEIKYAAYAPIEDGGMGRVELLSWGHKKKAAEEYELAKAGKELSWSMSARVPEDVCNCCRHRAKSPADYCPHMKNQAGQYVPEFRKYAFVWNPNPTFFDDSRVLRRADRIASFLQYKFPDQDMAKAASAQDQVILGTEWAEYEGVTLPKDQAEYMIRGKQAKLLDKLVALEKEAAQVLSGNLDVTTDQRRAFIKLAASGTLGPDLSLSQIKQMQGARPGTLFRELAKRAAVLPFTTFYAFVHDQDPEKISEDPVVKRAAFHLPSIMGLIQDEGVPAPLKGLFDMGDEFSCGCDGARKDLVQGLMDKADEEFGICPEQARPRIIRMTVTRVKSSSAAVEELEPEKEQAAIKLAKAYGMYQLQALSDIQELHGDRIQDPELFTALLHNQKNW